MGQRFDPPISFELDYFNALNFFNNIEKRTTDYIIFNAFHITCAELENLVIPILGRLSGFEGRKFSELGAVFVARKDRFNETVAASMEAVRSVRIGTVSPQLYALMMRTFVDETDAHGTLQLTDFHNVPSQVWCKARGTGRKDEGEEWRERERECLVVPCLPLEFSHPYVPEFIGVSVNCM